jgi:Cytochrome P460
MPSQAKLAGMKERSMKRRISILVIAATVAASVGGAMTFSAGGAGYERSLIFDGRLPPGYRDWGLISVAHEEGALNDIRAILGNDVAIKAYREGKFPYPDGTIIARLAWNYVSSEENNRVFGHPQSFVAGSPTNVQFMVKDSKIYASTGGWGFAQFTDGKPADIIVQDCFSCHVPAKGRDYLFTRYAP